MNIIVSMYTNDLKQAKMNSFLRSLILLFNKKKAALQQEILVKLQTTKTIQ